MANEIAENNKRLAKNSAMLYVRMVFTMVVALYTSRVVLKELGVEDYGVYGVVGGITTTLAFLNNSMAGATSRFLTFELGRKNYRKLHDTFSLTFWIHLGLAAILLILTELIVGWLLYHKLSIPADRMYAATWVFHTSVLSLFIGVLQVPFTSSIMAHERLDVFAYIEMGQSTWRLLVALALPFFTGDKLILYSILILLISVGACLFCVFYTIHHFPECKPKRIWDKTLFKELMSFSTWDLLENMAGTLRNQGIGYILNVFWGVIVNAANSLAWNVQNMVSAVATNISTAIHPQIVKYYAIGDYNQMVNLSHNAIRLISLVMAFIVIPFIIEIDFLLDLWLDQVPVYANLFSQLALFYSWIWTITSIMGSCIRATGRIRNYSILNSITQIIILGIAYIGAKGEMQPWIVFFACIVGGVFSLVYSAVVLNRLIPIFQLKDFFIKDLLPNWITFAVASVICLAIHSNMEEGWLRLIAVGACSTTLLGLVGFYVLLPVSFRNKVVVAVKNKFSKK